MSQARKIKGVRVDLALIALLVVIAGGLGAKLLLDQRAGDADAPGVVAVDGSAVEGSAVDGSAVDGSAVDGSTLGGSLPGALGPVGDQARRVDGDPLALGAVDAPIVLVEYSDYRCPFCGKFSRSTAPDLIDRYVDAGLLRIEWRDFPIFGEQSILAARAGRAAAAQGRFWEYNAALFAAAPPTGHAEMTPERLRGFAEQAGVPDLERFTADLGSEQFDAAISTDWSEAQSLGVTSTPSFAVHGHPIAGAQPTDTFTKLIDNLLAAR